MFAFLSKYWADAVGVVLVVLVIFGSLWLTYEAGHSNGKTESDLEWQEKWNQLYVDKGKADEQAAEASKRATQLQAKIDQEFTPAIADLQRQVAKLSAPGHRPIRVCDGAGSVLAGGAGGDTGSAGKPNGSAAEGEFTLSTRDDVQPELVRFGGVCERLRLQVSGLQEYLRGILPLCSDGKSGGGDDLLQSSAP